MAVRWLPRDANGDAAAKACEKMPAHPTLPRIRQTGQVGQNAFVAMDFPEGQLLSATIGERLDIHHLIRIGAQLSDALSTIHEQNVVHGELSPESVLLVPEDKAFLWDMPLVIANRLTDRRGENRLMQKLVAIAAYLAPERAQGAGASRAGDVYALGAVLCAAAGAPLPTSATTLGVVHLVANGEWQPRVPNALPDPWRTMVQRMVSRDPAARPSAYEVAQCFSHQPAPQMLPTVPEMQAVKLPPELMAAAEKAATARVPVVPEPVPTLKLDFAALEAKPLPPVPAMTPAAEAKTMPIDAAMLPVPMASPGVVLTDSVAVSSEMARAGAVALSPEEAALLDRPSKKRPVALFVGVGAAVIALSGIAALASNKPAPAPVAPVAAPAAVVAPVQVAPAPAVEDDSEDLMPLSAAPKSPRVHKAKKTARRDTANTTNTTAPGAAAPSDNDFGFLNDSTELKRPE